MLRDTVSAHRTTPPDPVANIDSTALPNSVANVDNDMLGDAVSEHHGSHQNTVANIDNAMLGDTVSEHHGTRQDLVATLDNAMPTISSAQTMTNDQLAGESRPAAHQIRLRTFSPRAAQEKQLTRRMMYS